MDLKLHPMLRDHPTTLCNDPKTTVVVLSGSVRNVLDENFGEFKIWLAVKHGMFLCHTGGEWMTPMPKYINTDLLDSVKNVFDYFTERTPISNCEIRTTSLVWNYKYAGAAMDRIVAKIVRSKPLMSPIDYILCLGHFQEKDEDVYKFFEPELPLDLGYPRTMLSDPTKSPSLEKRAPQKPTASKACSKSAKALSKKKLANENHHQNGALNGKGKTTAVEEKSMQSVLDLDMENYYSCAVGRIRTSTRYTLKSPGDVVLFLSCLAAGNYEVGSESESESSLRD